MHQTNRLLVVGIGFGKFEWALEKLFGSRGVLLLQEWQAGSIWQCVVRSIDHKAVCAVKSRSALFEDLDIAEWLPGMMFGQNNIAECLTGTIFGPSDWFVSLHLIVAMLCFTLSLPLSLLCLVPSCHCYALFHLVLAVLCCTLSLVVCVPLGYCCTLFQLVTGVFCALLSLLRLVCCCIMCCLRISLRKTMRILHHISFAAEKFQTYIMLGWVWVARSMCWLWGWLVSRMRRLCMGIMSLWLVGWRLFWVQAALGKLMGLIWLALTEDYWIILLISLIKLTAQCGYWARELMQQCLINLFILLELSFYVAHAVACFLLGCANGIQPEGNEGAWLNKGRLTWIIAAAMLLSIYIDRSIVKWVGCELISLGRRLVVASCQLCQDRYTRWEYLWNMLGRPGLKRQKFELRNGKSICRYQWWLGKNRDKLWLDYWSQQYSAHKVAFNKHVALGAQNSHVGVGKKCGEKGAGVTPIIKGGGGAAKLAGYTNKTLMHGKRKISEKFEGVNKKYWVGLRWLTAVDFWLFMDRHKQKIRRQVPMFSQIVIEQLDKLIKLRSQETWTGSQELHKELVVLNTGDHWLLAAIDYAGNRIVLMDPYGVEKDLKSVMEVRSILEGANWTVYLRKMGCQQLEDGNSCGYHVLQWIWQLANSWNLEAEDWVPARYDLSQWIIKVQKELGFPKKGETQRKKMARRGPVRYTGIGGGKGNNID